MKQEHKPSERAFPETGPSRRREAVASERMDPWPRYCSSGEFLRSRVVAFDHFTPRQQEVVELVLRGMSNREIGQRLRIEVETVKVHLKEIFLRVNVHRRSALVAKLLTPRFPE
jgi:DNA-binding NarL/FixJ family response regulator